MARKNRGRHPSSAVSAYPRPSATEVLEDDATVVVAPTAAFTDNEQESEMAQDMMAHDADLHVIEQREEGLDAFGRDHVHAQVLEDEHHELVHVMADRELDEAHKEFRAEMIAMAQALAQAEPTTITDLPTITETPSEYVNDVGDVVIPATPEELKRLAQEEAALHAEPPVEPPAAAAPVVTTVSGAYDDFVREVQAAEAARTPAPAPAKRVKSGKEAVTGAPTRDDLPAIKAGPKAKTGTLFDSYIKSLLDAGFVDEAGAVGNLYNRLVRGNWVSVPEDAELLG